MQLPLQKKFCSFDNGCFQFTSFLLQTENCPPTVYNAVSPNSDGSNDAFFIDGLRDIFVNFELLIYNRWVNILWTGNNNKQIGMAMLMKELEVH